MEFHQEESASLRVKNRHGRETSRKRRRKRITVQDSTLLSPLEDEVQIQSRPLEPGLLYQPSCPEDKLSLRMAKHLERFQWNQMWIGMVPSRIGYNRTLDQAVSAYLEACRIENSLHLVARKDAITLYVQAIDFLKGTIDSKSSSSTEEIQLTVAVLSAYEATIGASSQKMFIHKEGLLTLLTRSSHATEVTRALAYDEMSAAYLLRCAQGVPSEFDSPFWLNLDPTSRQAPMPVVASLRKTAYRLNIRLPGLTARVRYLRSNSSDADAMCHAAKLGRECCSEEDSRAENELLHAVSVTRSHSTGDENEFAIPVCLKFSTFAEFEAGVFYWQMRIMLNRLCGNLQRILNESGSFNLDKMNRENCRMAMNLLMAWETMFDHSRFGIVRGGAGTMTFAIAMIAVWGVLTDVTMFHGHSSTEVREWALERCQILMKKGLTKISAQEMDEMADLFAGGPVQGLIPFLVLGR